MMKKRKEFLLDESTLAILEQYRDKHHSRSLAEAFSEIVDEYKHRNDVPAAKVLMEGIANQVAEKLSDTLTRIRLGTNNADRNSDIILMLLNTLCSYSDFNTLIAEETPQLQRAKEIEKERIKNFREGKLDRSKSEADKKKSGSSYEVISDDDLLL